MLKHIQLDRPLAVIDLETTGTDPKLDRIIEISLLRVRPDGGHDHRTRRVNPGVPIPQEATAIHGISDDDVAESPTFRAIAPGLARFLDGCDLAGFNILNFDLRLLAAEFNRVGLVFPVSGRRIIDACRIYHQREPRDLTAAFKFYCGLEHEAAHGAAADVLVTTAILDAQVARYDDLPWTIDGLHAHCNDANAIDMSGMFGRDEDGVVVFIRGKYRGRSLSDIAASKPDISSGCSGRTSTRTRRPSPPRRWDGRWPGRRDAREGVDGHTRARGMAAWVRAALRRRRIKTIGPRTWTMRTRRRRSI